MALRDSNVSVIMNDRNLFRMNIPGGSTFRWTLGLARQVEVVAQTLLVPGHGRRTSRLANTMQVSATPLGHLGVQGNVVAKAPYAIYVHEGTGPRIYGNGGWLRLSPAYNGHPVMVIPNIPPSRRALPSQSRRMVAGGGVAGQAPNPFLADALRIVMAGSRVF